MPANYAVAKEKLSMMEAFVEYGLFLVWMMGMIYWIDSLVMAQNTAVQSIVAVLGMLLINGLVMLPFGWIAKFKNRCRVWF